MPGTHAQIPPIEATDPFGFPNHTPDDSALASLSTAGHPAWADEVEESEDQDQEPIQTLTETIEPDGTKVVTEIRFTDDGKEVKVTRRIRRRLIKTKAVNHAVVERMRWKKFGDAAEGLASALETTKKIPATTLGEEVFLKLAPSVGVGGSTAASRFDDVADGDEAKRKAALKQAKIVCRICKGEHWTSRCPFKDTELAASSLAAAEATRVIQKQLQEVTEARSASPATPPTAAAESTAEPKPGKYIPPSLRRGASAASLSDTTTTAPTLPGWDSRTNAWSIRISNLQDDTTDSDIRDLTERFGRLFRVHVKRHDDTGLCKGYAFATFFKREDAAKALEVLNGYG
ncbi:translation initiation factor eIF3 subunit g, partial [Quaeritorhiza haematococci]